MFKLPESQTYSGIRLDGRLIGDVDYPQRPIVCSGCGFVDFQMGVQYPGYGFEKIGEWVRSTEYQEMAATEGVFFRLGKIYEQLGKEHGEIAWTYLRAVWEAEDRENAEQLNRYLECCFEANQLLLGNIIVRGH